MYTVYTVYIPPPGYQSPKGNQRLTYCGRAPSCRPELPPGLSLLVSGVCWSPYGWSRAWYGPREAVLVPPVYPGILGHCLLLLRPARRWRLPGVWPVLPHRSPCLHVCIYTYRPGDRRSLVLSVTLGNSLQVLNVVCCPARRLLCVPPTVNKCLSVRPVPPASPAVCCWWPACGWY